MRGYLFIFLVSFLNISSVAQDWVNGYGYGGNDRQLQFRFIADYSFQNGYAIAGVFAHTSLDLGCANLSSIGTASTISGIFNHHGECIWSIELTNINGIGITLPRGLNTDEKGNIYLVVEVNGDDRIKIGSDTLLFQKSNNLILIKFNSSKKLEWYRILSDGNLFKFNGMVISNNRLYAGTVKETTGFNIHPIENSCIDEAGNLIWKDSLTFVGSLIDISVQHPKDFPMSILCRGEGKIFFNSDSIQTNLDNLIQISYETNGAATFDYLNLKLDADKYVWKYFLHENSLYTLSISFYDTLFSVFYKYHLNKMDALGNPVWTQPINFNLNHRIILNFDVDMVFDLNNNIYLFGHAAADTFFFASDTLILTNGKELNEFYYDGILLKYDDLGNEKYAKWIGDESYDQIYDMLVLKEDSLVAAGIYCSQKIIFGNNTLYNDNEVFYDHNPRIKYRIAKSFIAFLNNGSITGITPNLNSDLINILVYPNPTTNTLYLQSEAFTGQPVQVQIFSADGRLVRQQNISGAMQTIQIQTGDLPPGMYIATTIINQQISNARFVKQ